MKKLLFTLLSFLMVATVSQAQIVITEILYNIPGSGENEEFVELYNTTTSPINMNNYVLSDNFATDTFQNVTLPANGFVVVAADSLAFIAAFGQFPDNEWSAGLGNNGDYVVLRDGAGNVLDSVNYDDASPWPTDADGGGSSLNLCDPAADNNAGANWSASTNFIGVNGTTGTDSLYGSPYAFDNGCPTGLEVNFAVAAASVNESVGTVTVNVSIANPNANPTSVDVVLNAATTATILTDYTYTSPTTVTFPANSSAPQTVTITIVDDAVTEPTEMIVLELTNPTNGALLGTDSLYTLDIVDNDAPVGTYNYSDISAVHGEDANGVATSLNDSVELRAVVHCGDFDGNQGVQFWIIESDNDGINVFNFNDVSNYTVTEGDSIHVWGTIDQFNGLTQVFADSIELISSGNATLTPMAVTALDESTEGRFIQLNNVSVVDTAAWNTGSSFNVDVTDGTNTYTVRIDSDIDLANQSVPTGTFGIYGFGGQFDNSSPFDEGYQLQACNSSIIVSNNVIAAQNNEVSIFPNPTTDVLNVRASNIDMIVITNVMGQEVVRLNNVTTNTTAINIRNLANGMYNITVVSNGALTTKQFVKK